MTKFPPVLFLFIILAGCVPLRPYAPRETIVTYSNNPVTASSPEERLSPQIRVAVVVCHTSTKLIVPFEADLTGISSLDSKVVYQKGKKMKLFDLTVHDLESSAAFIEPRDSEEVEVDGNRYQGSIELVEEKHGCLTVINELPLEEYVMGVLAGEIPGSWPMEALKAQAIAARTFALYKRAEAKKKGQVYDLESTASAQMYIGSRFVNKSIREAVNGTEGEILTYRDQPIMAVFHSNCGGETTGALDVWGKDQPYLRPVSCSFGDHGPHYQWKENLKISDVVRKLRAANIMFSDIVQISSIDRDDSRRVKKLILMDGDGSKKQINGAVFRMALGPDVIRSTCFEVKLDGDKMIFHGRGWGHGVGLCQEGAYGMAKAGYGAFDILRHYYYGVILDKINHE